jgi:hypothetical protein
LEKLIVLICFLAGAALLALFAQGTRVIMSRGGLRFALRRFLPWIMWAAMVAAVV